jgi:hypothetical protein
VIITYEGRTYDFDLEDLTVRQAIRIEKHIGGTLEQFEKGIGTGNLACYQALGWLILHGGDEGTPIGDVDFKIARLSKAFEAAVLAEAEAAKAAEAGPDPTGPAADSNGRTSVPVSSPSG